MAVDGSGRTERFPTGGAYVDALQNTTICFKEPELKGARPRLDRLGRPRPISGAFASVFSLTTASGRRYAVKCFTREVTDQETRYRAISDHLAGLSHRWKVAFDYLAQGVLVDGRWYPILKMEWVEAASLTQWIEQHLQDRSALAALADHFVALVADLTAAGIAHGDLQHGNMLVTPDGSLRLVDYDGMYVPALAGLSAAEMGHRNYQPPTRSATDFGPLIDRFSAWVIYLSLVALAIEPTLWHQLRERDAEHLLLAEDDFKDPAASPRFPALLSHTAPGLRDLAQNVHNLLALPLSRIPELAAVDVKTCTTVASVGPASTSAPPTSGLPTWMASHIAQPPPIEQVSFTQRSTALRVVGIAVLLMLPALVLLAAVGVIAPAVAAAAALITLPWLTRSAVLYHRRPETKQARAARTRVSETINRLSEASDEVAELEPRTRELDQATADRNAAHADKQQQLQSRHDNELATIKRTAQQRLAGIGSALRTLSTERNLKLETALLRLQEDHIATYLAKIRISSAALPGIGTSLINNLRAEGIATAADFTGVVYDTNLRYQSRVALFQLRNGRAVRVPGIGEVKAERLDSWRQDCANRAQNTQPTSLPTAQQRTINERYTAREHQLRLEHQQITTNATQQQSVLAQRLAVDRTSLADELRRANTAAAQARKDHDRRTAEARRRLNDAQRQQRAAAAELATYRRISYLRYLRFTFGKQP